MTVFQIPIERPEEVRPRLGDPDRHWKPGRSAFELATAWMRAGDIPALVRSVLDQAPEWTGAELLEAIFERSTALPGRGYASQTDLLGIISLADGNAILGVEAKVDEPFGELVGEWLEGTLRRNRAESDADFELRRERSKTNRADRLQSLCGILEVDEARVGDLHYQLIHRTCAAVYEAKRFRYRRAMMLVHSFAAADGTTGFPPCFEEFRAFSHVLGMPVSKPGSVSLAKSLGGVELRLGWVTDAPATLEIEAWR